jgi:hypothetical protein
MIRGLYQDAHDALARTLEIDPGGLSDADKQDNFFSGIVCMHGVCRVQKLFL